MFKLFNIKFTTYPPPQPGFCFSHKYLSWLPPPVAVVLLSVASSFCSWAKFSSAKSCKTHSLAVKRPGASLTNLGRRPSCQHNTCYLTYGIECYILVKLTSAASWTDIPPFAPGSGKGRSGNTILKQGGPSIGQPTQCQYHEHAGESQAHPGRFDSLPRL